MTDMLRARRHDLCTNCRSHSYDTDANYCMRCGWSENSPIWGALLMVAVCLVVLAGVGWLMS